MQIICSFRSIKYAFIATLFTLVACAPVETHKTIQPTTVPAKQTSYQGPKTTLVVANFDNRSNYMQGLFSTGTNRLGNQAKTILKSHLQQSQRFRIVDRENMAEIQQEAALIGKQQTLKGARYAITGAVSEFGRKTTGDRQLFGILGSGKTQTAYSKVTLSVVDVLTSEIVFSTQGAGEYALSEREVLGFGSDTGYDATLNGKVLNLSIMEATNNLITAIENGTFAIQQ